MKKRLKNRIINRQYRLAFAQIEKQHKADVDAAWDEYRAQEEDNRAFERGFGDYESMIGE